MDDPAGLLGMASKFTECILGGKYRQQHADGTVLGGPMYYLSQGLADQGKPVLGRVLAVVFAVCCIGGAIGGGNMCHLHHDRFGHHHYWLNQQR